MDLQRLKVLLYDLQQIQVLIMNFQHIQILLRDLLDLDLDQQSALIARAPKIHEMTLVKDLWIKMLEARLKMLETRLEMERHPEDHACQSAAMLHELLNDMENLRME
ncbi:hypothetical protein Tco_0558576 [Tanacetum coccineum]